jgi:Rhs element Vgr protein
MAQAANKSKHDVSTFKIIVDGNELDSTSQLLSISIMKEVNRISTAKIIIRDGEAADKNFSLSEKKDFVPGKPIQIQAGRDGDNSQFFKGIITRHGIRIRENGNSELHIECHDEAVRMTIGRKSRYYEKIKDSTLFEQLAKLNKVKADPDTTTLEHKELVQHHISDWDFLLLRAEANAMLVLTEDGTVKVFKPNTNSAPSQEIEFGSDIYEMEAEIDGRYQFNNIEATSWDYNNQDLFKSEVSSVKFKENGNIPGSDIAEKIAPDPYLLHHSGHRLEQELKDWASGVMMRSRLAKIRGRVKFLGNSSIKPGEMIKIGGVGSRFNGNAFVTAVKHDIGEGVWETDIQFGLDPRRYAELHNDDMNDRQSAGLVGSIHGLQIGKTVQLQNDPDGQDRIFVRLPVINKKAQGIWTRMASLDAGNRRGACFRPEVGDEVIVGFINDDPRDAVILGMLHSSAKPAPIAGSDQNHEKGFTTRSKMHISFNDNTKTIRIDTPAGNSIMLDEKGSTIEIVDQSKNKIVMTTSGIQVESQANIDIKAAAAITIKAGTTLSIAAPSISIKADANVSVEGSLAKFAAQGANVISGLPVKIN